MDIIYLSSLKNDNLVYSIILCFLNKYKITLKGGLLRDIFSGKKYSDVDFYVNDFTVLLDIRNNIKNDIYNIINNDTSLSHYKNRLIVNVSTYNNVVFNVMDRYRIKYSGNTFITIDIIVNDGTNTLNNDFIQNSLCLSINNGNAVMTSSIKSDNIKKVLDERIPPLKILYLICGSKNIPINVSNILIKFLGDFIFVLQIIYTITRNELKDIHNDCCTFGDRLSLQSSQKVMYRRINKFIKKGFKVNIKECKKDCCIYSGYFNRRLCLPIVMPILKEYVQTSRKVRSFVSLESFIDIKCKLKPNNQTVQNFKTSIHNLPRRTILNVYHSLLNNDVNTYGDYDDEYIIEKFNEEQLKLIPVVV